MVIIPALTCGMLARTSKLRSALKPEGGALKFWSTYPSNRKLNSVPHCRRGEGGGDAGAAGGASGVCARRPAAPARSMKRTRVEQYVPRMIERTCRDLRKS